MMSFLGFVSPSAASSAPRGASPASLRTAYSRHLLANHGGDYRQTVDAQRALANARQLQDHPSDEPLVGIVGGGFAGLFAGLILQSLGIECELFESSDRVGGRIDTWYSSDYDAGKPNDAGLYGEIGGMRLPQFSADMLPVQQLALAVNAVLERNEGLADRKVTWRKFYYDSPVQRLRYNDMPRPITMAEAGLSSFNFNRSSGGDVPDVWLTPKVGEDGKQYLPINEVLGKVNGPFITAINNSFAEGFALMMRYDQFSMWDYLTTVFTLGDLEEYYEPAMGAKSDFLPWPVASFLETTNVGTGMYSVSFVEMVIAVYDWGGSKDPYRPGDDAIYMLTVDEGMQRFPDACRTVLDLEVGVRKADGHLAQVQVGLLREKPGEPYSYTAPNLTPDARPPGAGQPPPPAAPQASTPTRRKRVFLRHKVVKLEHDPKLYAGHGGMRMTVESEAPPAPPATPSTPSTPSTPNARTTPAAPSIWDRAEEFVRGLFRRGDAEGAPPAAPTTATPDADRQVVERQFPYVITTLPNGAYLNGELKDNLLNELSCAKAQAIREANYMSSFKAFLTFTEQFWAVLGERQDAGLGAAATDRPNRQIIYPSYGYGADQGVLQVYCWDEDARRLGALSDEERVNECLKGIAYLYPEADVFGRFAGYDDGRTTKTWFWDDRSGGGAFALFNPGQFKNLYPTLLTPEFDGCLNFAGECCSVHHGWIVGALDSAYNAVYHVLRQAGADEQIREMEETWGAFAPPDVAADPTTANVLDYAYEYNEVDRTASSVPPGGTGSIYGRPDFVFTGDVPAFIADYSKVPQSMKKTVVDGDVLEMLNNQWSDNAARVKAAAAGPPSTRKPTTAVELLESIYYGQNFQTIPAPRFWLKDDDEFARQQLGGFMPTILQKVTARDVAKILNTAEPPNGVVLEPLSRITYVADYRRYLEACTVTPVAYYLAKPIVFFEVSEGRELMPAAIQLDHKGPLYWPEMPNADNAWLLAKMQTNCAGQTLHDVGFHQLYTHQLGALVSIALFSEEVFTPSEGSGPAFQQHPVFKLLRPHLVKTVEFQQTIYDAGYDPYYKPFPATREPNGQQGVYNLGFVYDLIFSSGRIGNYQLQDKMYNGDFEFLRLGILDDALHRGVAETEFSYPYVHDTSIWMTAIERFVARFLEVQYPGGDAEVAADPQLQRFFAKLIPAFNHVGDGREAIERFPAEVKTVADLAAVLTMIIWQFSVQHTVVNDGAYNQAAFVPNASTLMFPLPKTPSAEWTPDDVLACLPSQTDTFPELGGMTFTDIQINASVTGQGPYPETVLGRGVLQPSIDVMQDTYRFVDPKLRAVVDDFFESVRGVADAIEQRQMRDAARYLELHPNSAYVPETVTFGLVEPHRVMNTIQT